MPYKWYSLELNSTKYNIKKTPGKALPLGLMSIYSVARTNLSMCL